MSYAIEILRSAEKQLAAIDRQEQPRVIEAIRCVSPTTHARQAARN